MMLPNLILIAVLVGAFVVAARLGKRDPAALQRLLPVGRMVGGAAFVLIGLRTGKPLVAGIGVLLMVGGAVANRRRRLPL